MTKIILFLSFFFFFTPINQGFSADKAIHKLQYPTYGILQYFVPTHLSKTSVNSPICYLNQNFKSGKIITKTKGTITPEGIRYNISEEVIECKINKQYGRISFPRKLSEVEIDGNLFVFKKYLLKGDSLNGYLQKIHAGNKNLYIKYSIKKSSSETSGWNIKNVFFVEADGNFPKKVNSLKSEIINIYKGKEAFANSFMKKNNYSWKESKALVQLVTYLESLDVSKVTSR
ncbi:hypothetical protein ACT3CE_08715 [Marinifilum sp. RC60d5]|uniref:hypothetical protein n=1 Tax=Marinifilum sp. RC60d5 TaxID=3458414 RepID=UPI0040358B11